MPKKALLTSGTGTTVMPVSEDDRALIVMLAAESLLAQMDILHQLVWLSRIRARVAQEGAEIDATMAGSEIELFTLLVLHDCGMLTHEEFSAGLVLANRYPHENVAERLTFLKRMIIERIHVLQPHWAERRQELERAKIQWGYEHATVKPVYQPPVDVAVDAE